MSIVEMPVSMGELQQLALKCARGDGFLAEEAIQHLRIQCWQGRYDPTRPFIPWACRVMSNYCRSYLSRESKIAKKHARFAESMRGTGYIKIEEQNPRTGFLTPSELEALTNWPVTRQFVTLMLLDLWNEISTEYKGQILQKLDLTIEDVSVDFGSLKKSEQITLLSEFLHLTRENINQIYCRGRKAIKLLIKGRESCQ